MGELENLHFYDFGISGRVPEPQNQFYVSLGTPRYLTNSKKIPGRFLGKHIFANVKYSEIPKMLNIGRRWAPTNEEESF